MIIDYNGDMGKFSYDDKEYMYSKRTQSMRYIGKSNKPTYLEGCVDYACLFSNVPNEYIDLSDWDTSKVLCMQHMFSYSHITSVEGLKNLDVSNLFSTADMFYGCKYLKDISPLKDWDTSKVKCMNMMFFECSILENIKGLENWNTSNAKEMYLMFGDCNNLKDTRLLDSWNLKKIDNYQGMFTATHPEADLPIWYMESELLKDYYD